MATVDESATNVVVPVEVYVPLTLTFDAEAVTKAVAEISADGLEDLREATLALHETQSYADICGYFADTLGVGGYYLADETGRWFGLDGLDANVWVDVGLVPAFRTPESAMNGIYVAARLTVLSGPPLGGANKTVVRFFDDERGLRGEDRDPLATILSIGRSIAGCLTAEMAGADKFDTSRCRQEGNREEWKN
ncbi:Uncharacterised protein [Mycobacteroides abscessus subsp. bolletii]|uniref:hypothetical protein n=1 Tax=Mycobacteroides abscessus TaxID=36809 RepID=UPI0009A8304B|nr:hypothetical protein [Mycobacteroides abscessus]SKZ04001.1 Uncharacterised protein [Mycobacteroides abscessus subsp. bolletii]